MQRLFDRALFVLAGFVLVLTANAALAQYQVTNLDSDLKGKAKHQDTLLKNAWGLAYAPGGPFWISDEASGWTTLYDGTGVIQSIKATIPSASGTGPGTPTGIVYNASTEFKIRNWTSVFLFATLDGTISGWSGFNASAALLGATKANAAYTGLAITHKSSGNVLFAADNASNMIDIYDANFKFVKSFTDTTIPAGFSVFGIQDIGGNLYVSYASTSGAAGGYIDIFGEDGTFMKRLTHGKPLNQPWGIATAPKNFGPLSGLLLVSNNAAGGTINGFNLTTGKFVATMLNASLKPLVISGLWGIGFGGGTSANGNTNQLFFTAGPNDTDGYFGVINFK